MTRHGNQGFSLPALFIMWQAPGKMGFRRSFKIVKT